MKWVNREIVGILTTARGMRFVMQNRLQSIKSSSDVYQERSAQLLSTQLSISDYQLTPAALTIMSNHQTEPPAGTAPSSTHITPSFTFPPLYSFKPFFTSDESYNFGYKNASADDVDVVPFIFGRLMLTLSFSFSSFDSAFSQLILLGRSSALYGWT